MREKARGREACEAAVAMRFEELEIQCVAVCCSVLQCVAVCCSVLQCVAVCCSVLQCFAVCKVDSGLVMHCSFFH